MTSSVPTMRASWVVWMLAVVGGVGGCTPENTWQGGTGVGNPGSAQASMQRGNEPVIEVALIDVAAFHLHRCDGTLEPSAVDTELDLFDIATFEVPGGVSCGLSLEPSGPLRVSGVVDTQPGKGTFEAVLDIGQVELIAPDFVVDGTALVLELAYPGWLEDLDLQDGTHTEVSAATEPGLHDALVIAVEQGSGLFVDADANGVLDDSERLEPLAVGPAWDEEDDD